MQNAIGSNYGTMYVVLDEFHDRHGGELGADAIAAKLRAACYREVQEAQVAVFGAPPVDGLGSAGGFKVMVRDVSDLGLDPLQEAADGLAASGNEQPGLVGLFSAFRAQTPQMYVDVDRERCKAMGVALNEVFLTLQLYLGGYYTNDFNQFGRTWQVNLQGDPRFRLTPEQVQQVQQAQQVQHKAQVDHEPLSGPVVDPAGRTDVVSNQGEVDDLLASLGF